MSWLRRVVGAGMGLALASLAVGCNTFGDFGGMCVNDDDCDVSWQQCNEGSGLCIKRPEMRTCIYSETSDSCGVGSTCQKKREGGVCIDRPIKIGVVVDTGGEVLSVRQEYERLVNEYVLEDLDVPKTFPGQSDRPWNVDMLYRVSTQTETSRRGKIDELLREDVDILVTYFSSVYQHAREMSAQRETLILGLQNRRLDTIKAERASEEMWAAQDATRAPGTLPALPDFRTLQDNLFSYNQDRYDFSLLPVQTVEATAIITYAREELGCQSISMLLDRENPTQLLYEDLLTAEARRQGICARPSLDVGETPKSEVQYEGALEQLRTLNRPEHCIWIPSGRQTGVLAFLEAWEKQNSKAAFHFIIQKEGKDSVMGFNSYTKSGLRGQTTLYLYNSPRHS